MAPQLIQVKVKPELKQDLQDIAEYKGLPLSSYIKMTLTEAAREEKKTMLTINGFTEEEEQEILRREKEALAMIKKGKMKTFHTASSLLKHLNDSD